VLRLSFGYKLKLRTGFNQKDKVTKCILLYTEYATGSITNDWNIVSSMICRLRTTISIR